MDLKTPVKLSEIANLIDGRVMGDGDMLVTGLNEIHKVREGDMTFVDFHKYYDVALGSEVMNMLPIKVGCRGAKSMKINHHWSPFPVAKCIRNEAPGPHSFRCGTLALLTKLLCNISFS